MQLQCALVAPCLLCHRVCRTDLNVAKQCLIYAVNCVTGVGYLTCEESGFTANMWHHPSTLDVTR